ncbi:acyltransferase [Microbacterium sp. HD4P20]|uniref:acyltransferase family protein n=1 Tax=Microbacterium sp. HD4P20 TaxID=2864874 RepID=UPI001C6421C4|nr:acyltransferase family protein [Microbacterium sp. HD4P20]MCP2637514.1 acyltransferase [Microbacterium sp. HD4P20]
MSTRLDSRRGSATPNSDLSDAQPSRSGFRLDVQALRAVAIAAVVINHLWPTRLTGGYVGVDVFFVISGFLITGHLLREVAASGRIRLGAFYARRIRRLLPAALLVLAISAILVWAFLPYPRWERNAAEIAASAGYVENWLLAGLSINYSALNDSASVAQHYWSLSVEEQFYLVWPLLIGFGVLACGRFFGQVGPHRVVLALLLGVVVVSFGASVAYTAAEPAQAYFVTFTRGWEFALGGVVAVAGSRIRMPRLVANLLALAGFAAVTVSAVVYGPETPFPGVAALLPVAGTAAIIAAGSGGHRLWHSSITDWRPVQWIGGISYSLYLWHWPLIVVAPFLLRAELNALTRIALLSSAVLLAWLTKLLVEDPGREWRFWRTSTRHSVILMLAGMGIVIALAGGLFGAYQLKSAADSPDAPIPSGACDGPAALSATSVCVDPFGPASTTYMTERNEYFHYPEECGETRPDTSQGELVPVIICDYSEGDADASEVWMVGDSHVQQWQGATFELAKQHGWRVTLAYRGHCPAADVAYIGFRSPATQEEVDACRRWSRGVSAAVVHARPDIVLTAMASRQHLVDDGSGRSASEQFQDGLLADWNKWADAGVRVAPIADPPYNGEVRDPDCVVLNQANPLECARPRVAAQPSDPIVVAASRADRPGIQLIDLTDYFCDADTCYSVVGGVPVYYDADHLNLVYVRMLATAFGEALAR